MLTRRQDIAGPLVGSDDEEGLSIEEASMVNHGKLSRCWGISHLKKKTFIEDFPDSHVSLPGGYNCPRESRHSQASCHTIKVLQRAGHGNQLGIRADDHPMSSAFQSVSNSPILWSRCLILHIPPSDVAKWCVSAIFQWIGFHGKILTGKPH